MYVLDFGPKALGPTLLSSAGRRPPSDADGRCRAGVAGQGRTLTLTGDLTQQDPTSSLAERRVCPEGVGRRVRRFIRYVGGRVGSPIYVPLILEHSAVSFFFVVLFGGGQLQVCAASM